MIAFLGRTFTDRAELLAFHGRIMDEVLPVCAAEFVLDMEEYVNECLSRSGNPPARALDYLTPMGRA